MFPDLSFGNADSDKVEARKTQLDTFLKVGIRIITYRNGFCVSVT